LSNFNRSIQTDNETYVNATLWKDINYEGYDFRLAVNYYLGLNDENLSITIYGKNTGIDIPFDLGFAWKVTDINIPPSNVSDEITINVTIYPLNETYNSLFKDMDIANFKIRDGCRYLRIDWNENLSYAVKMYGDGNQEDFYVMLLINTGNFTTGQEKSTTFYWIDAGTCSGTPTLCRNHYDGMSCMDCGCFWDIELEACSGIADPCEFFNDETFCNTCGCDWTEVHNVWVNVGDVWQDVEAVYVNVADVWQDVEAVYVNVADVWRQIQTY